MQRLLSQYLILLILLLPAAVVSAQTGGGISNGVSINDPAVTIVGDRQVAVTMQLRFDGLRLRSNEMRVYTPYIVGLGGEEFYLPSVMVAGRRQHFVQQREPNPHYPGAIEVWRRNGTAQQVDYRQVVELQPWMYGAAVRIVEDSCGCGVTLAKNAWAEPLGRVRQEPERVLAIVSISCVKPRYSREEKTYAIEGRAFLDFRVNRVDIDAGYRKNPAELAKIMRSIDAVRDDSNATITGISIHGYASPEGKYSRNVYLAENRALALRDYVCSLRNFPADVFTVRSTPEDWDGLDSLISRSKLPQRQEMLDLVRTEMDPDRKNDELRRRWPDAYTNIILKEWYPALRHSDYVVNYTVRSFTTAEEALRVYRDKPYQLSLSELYMVANTFQEGSEEYNEVLRTAGRLYPDDAEANLNVAIIALQQRDLPTAEAHLQKSGDSVEAQHARGVLALLQGRIADAAPLLEAAAAAGVPHAADNLRAQRMLE